jgi:hypothetical protein
MSYVALTYSEDERGPADIPRLEGAEALSRPVVLCSQQRINKLSTKHNRAEGPEKARLRTALQNLLQFGGKDRFGLWDEAFHSADIAAIGSAALLSANSLIKLNGLVEESGNRRDVVAAADQLKSICRQMAAARSGASRTSNALDRKGKELTVEIVEASGYQWLAERLGLLSEHGSQATVKQLAEVSGCALQVYSFPSNTGTQAKLQLVQAVAKVDPMFKRVVVLDASYRIAVLSASDRTIRPSNRLSCADVTKGHDRLIPKEFRDVHVTFCRGHSGRHNMEASRKNRAGMIRRQVERIAEHVPSTERFLICTFKGPDPEELLQGHKVLRNGRLVNPVDWISEIKAELQAQAIPNWKERAEFVTWGMHRGRNCWRSIRYGFALGLMSRQWSGDLHPRAKALEGDLIHAGQTAVANAQQEGVLAELAADIQQLLGRLHCRNTLKVAGRNAGQSGETWFWLEMFEPRTRKALRLETSPLAHRLREVMPGIRLNTSNSEGLDEDERESRESKKAASGPTAEEQFKAAALKWIAAQNGSQVNSVDLTAAVKADEACRELLSRVNDKTLRRGIAAAKKELLASGRWEAKSSRCLVAVS